MAAFLAGVGFGVWIAFGAHVIYRDVRRGTGKHARTWIDELDNIPARQERTERHHELW